ncbi:targeting protein for Xklp2 homolog [Eupeodes corollae]|uniref:targeting protein for Xklp2 homolog n=1 Tax=Eupeodes corollae TaxID=290404 RepID=UPI0024910B99|nr:targeting protein for Xklp2 homolog [Eupeodes corollae]
MLGQTSYNWDDIQVGRFDLNHSEHFFSRKHQKHEKFSEDFGTLQAMAALNLNESFSNDNAIDSKEDKENVSPIASSNQSKNNDCLLSQARDEKCENENVAEVDSPISVEPLPPSPTPSTSKRPPANLLTKFRTPTTTVPKNVKPTAKVEHPHAYDFKDIYKKKKEEIIKRLLEEEKKNRVFHSRPVPKHKAMPAKIVHNLTVPKTPVVLKTSQAASEKRRQMLEEYKKQNAAQKFTSRRPMVLNDEPFKPKKTSQPVVASQPFKLSVERRLEERKQYDEQIRIAAEERKKQEEEERKKHEEEIVKELRKLASFKARPNPFK